MVAILAMVGCVAPPSDQTAAEIEDLRGMIEAQQIEIDALRAANDALAARLPAGDSPLVSEEVLTDYARVSDLTTYVDETELDAALSTYASIADVDTCVDPEELDEVLLGFATTELVTSTYATLADLDSLADADRAYTEAAVAVVAAQMAVVAATFTRVEADETWTIDPSGAGDFLTLDDAVEALDGVWVDADATLTLQLAP